MSKQDHIDQNVTAPTETPAPEAEQSRQNSAGAEGTPAESDNSESGSSE